MNITDVSKIVLSETGISPKRYMDYGDRFIFVLTDDEFINPISLNKETKVVSVFRPWEDDTKGLLSKDKFIEIGE